MTPLARTDHGCSSEIISVGRPDCVQAASTDCGIGCALSLITEFGCLGEAAWAVAIISTCAGRVRYRPPYVSLHVQFQSAVRLCGSFIQEVRNLLRYLIGGCEHWIGREMRVARRCLHLRMAQQFANNRQTLAHSNCG